MTKSAQRDPMQVLDRLAEKQSFAKEITRALLTIPRDSQSQADKEIYVLAKRIEACNNPTNTWIYPGELQTETGSWTPTGRYWRCGSKLCPSCCSNQARINRGKLMNAIGLDQTRSLISFLTLTIPNPSLSIIKTRELVNRAWSLLRKRFLWRDFVYGGCKSEEFTLTAKGIHYHLHLVIKHRRLVYDEFRRSWTECVAQAFEDVLKKKMECPATSDGLLFVKFLKLNSATDAVKEVCKYITKSDSWHKIDRAALAEIALVRRWSRMFELFGCFRQLSPDQPEKDEQTTHEISGTESAIVHTRFLSDGGDRRSVYWRDRLLDISCENYCISLQSEIDRVTINRREQIQLRYNVPILWNYAEIIDHLSRSAA